MRFRYLFDGTFLVVGPAFHPRRKCPRGLAGRGRSHGQQHHGRIPVFPASPHGT